MQAEMIAFLIRQIRRKNRKVVTLTHHLARLVSFSFNEQIDSYFKIGFFGQSKKNLKAKKHQNSRKKPKFKLKTEIVGIFGKKIVPSLKTCFYPF